MSSKSRSLILSRMVKILGFYFREEALPSELRDQLDDIAEELDRYEAQAKRLETLKAKEKEKENSPWLFLLGFSILAIILGMVTCLGNPQSLTPLAAPVGAFLFFGFLAFISYLRIKPKDVADKEAALASCWSDINDRIDQISKEAKGYLHLDDWRDCVSLEEDEYIVETCNLDLDITFEEMMDHYAHQDLPSEKAPQHGFVLTNMRFVVLSIQFTNSQRSKYKLRNTFSLTSIKDVVASDVDISPELIIHTNEGKHIYRNLILVCKGHSGHAQGACTDNKYLRKKIIEQIRDMKKPVADFSFLRTLIEKGGIVLTTLKCPHCSAPIKMPKSGNETKCNHCGSTILAQDIFEKLKELMD